MNAQLGQRFAAVKQHTSMPFFLEYFCFISCYSGYSSFGVLPESMMFAEQETIDIKWVQAIVI